jgi:uncharacterized protein (DUF1684 family)
MQANFRSRAAAGLLIVVLVLGVAGARPPGPAAAATPLDAERANIAAWRAQRARGLTGDSGWLTLAGLFWLKDGDNSFGRAPGNALVLDNAALAANAGAFVVSAHQVRFVARPDSGVTHDGQPVTHLDLVADTQGDPTVLASGSLRFLLIERAGNLGVRVRDLNNPRRLHFRGLEYFPVSTDWVVQARFEPYQPARRLKILNILGMEEQLECPGAVVFSKAGREWRLDAVLEAAGDQELFIMFADATSGHETYGAGRFLYIPLPRENTVQVDFNKAINPPCGLNDFATCPLPPTQNRLKLRVDAGEKKYAGAPEHGA